jgi:hypothetical protein
VSASAERVREVLGRLERRGSARIREDMRSRYGIIAPKAYGVGIPFSYTAYINTHWTTLVGMLGVLAILLPLTRALPALYVWMIRRRLVYWYRQLKALERNLDGANTTGASPVRRIARCPAHPRARRTSS